MARDQFTRLGRSYAPDIIILISTGDQDEPLEYGNPVTEAAANKSAGRAIFIRFGAGNHLLQRVEECTFAPFNLQLQLNSRS
ncbi:MAG: hypothetical protein BroJett038_26380 [Chloroflexota bacterium]|nr:MAG: hypothetical protein BroJett038_26380 [Chloroflexota bacterium]